MIPAVEEYRPRTHHQRRLAHKMRNLQSKVPEGTDQENCLHPATYMDTSMVRRAGVTPLSSVEEGARAILNLATSRRD